MADWCLVYIIRVSILCGHRAYQLCPQEAQVLNMYQLVPKQRVCVCVCVCVEGERQAVHGKVSMQVGAEWEDVFE